MRQRRPSDVPHVERVPHRRAGAARAPTIARRAQCAGGEVLARRRLVRELDALAGAGEDHRVLADDVAAAQRREADRARPALAGDALARVDGAVGERAARAARPPPRPAAAPCPTARRPCACGASRRSRCRKSGPSRCAAVLDELQQHVDADAHVGREDDRDRRARARRASSFCASERPVVPTTAAHAVRARRPRGARACRRAA